MIWEVRDESIWKVRGSANEIGIGVGGERESVMSGCCFARASLKDWIDERELVDTFKWNHRIGAVVPYRSSGVRKTMIIRNDDGAGARTPSLDQSGRWGVIVDRWSLLVLHLPSEEIRSARA